MLHAVQGQLVVNSPEMAARPRGTPVSIPPWWLKLATREKARAGWTGPALIEAIGKLEPRSDASADEPSLSRFFRGQITTIELADALRRVMDLPPFAFFADDEEEAWRLQSARDLYRQERRTRRTRSDSGPIREIEKEASTAGLTESDAVVLSPRDPSGETRKEFGGSGRGRRRGGVGGPR
jgi:hypothetical protein